MNDLQPATAGEVMARLRSLSLDELRAKIHECMVRTAASYIELAYTFHAFEEKGGKAAELSKDLVYQLRQIYYGTLLPEVVIRFFGRYRLIRYIAALPAVEQKRLAEGEPVDLLVYNAAGVRDTVKADPGSMVMDQVRQVFAPDHIRTVDEQLLIVLHENQKSSRPIPETIANCTVDKQRGGVNVPKRMFISKEHIKAMARLLGD